MRHRQELLPGGQSAIPSAPSSSIRQCAMSRLLSAREAAIVLTVGLQKKNAARPIPYPMPTFAAVDIGSNSVRLKIAKVVRGRLQTLHEDREVTRLGESVFANGSLDPQAMSLTINVLQRFHRSVQSFAADRVRVVATAALRDSRNSRAFLDWVRSATGWRTEIISGLEEGRLIHLGLLSNARIANQRALLIDLGGGSCELTITVAGHIEDMVSLPIGAVR